MHSVEQVERLSRAFSEQVDQRLQTPDVVLVLPDALLVTSSRLRADQRVRRTSTFRLVSHVEVVLLDRAVEVLSQDRADPESVRLF